MRKPLGITKSKTCRPLLFQCPLPNALPLLLFLGATENTPHELAVSTLW